MTEKKESLALEPLTEQELNLLSVDATGGRAACKWAMFMCSIGYDCGGCSGGIYRACGYRGGRSGGRSRGYGCYRP